MQLKEMEMRAIATVAQLQQEQQQQQQPVVSGASPPSSWQTPQSSNMQSPSSSEMSPGYTELSPGHDRQQLVPPGSPTRSQVHVWVGQQIVPAPNTTVADAKLG